ncbi:MAG: biotin/lipoyl-binding protein [Spirochaetia bacterium]|nr:biotin/lipoyl-binding protein [Spirochaetia bacterium]
MKQYRITVNGQSYDVMVEEVSAGTTAPTAAQAPRPAAAPAPAPAATPASAEASAAAAAVAPSAGALSVKAPMPGTVMAFKVTKGQAVKRGDVLLILEAMKMENEIVAPQDGTVVALRVPVSASVNTGDPLVDLA